MFSQEGGVRPPNLPLPWKSGTPRNTIVPAKWHANPSNGLSRVHECDRRQTDREIIVSSSSSGKRLRLITSRHYRFCFRCRWRKQHRWRGCQEGEKAGRTEPGSSVDGRPAAVLIRPRRPTRAFAAGRLPGARTDGQTTAERNRSTRAAAARTAPLSKDRTPSPTGASRRLYDILAAPTSPCLPTPWLKHAVTKQTITDSYQITRLTFVSLILLIAIVQKLLLKMFL